jgi:hypothetical protein
MGLQELFSLLYDWAVQEFRVHPNAIGRRNSMKFASLLKLAVILSVVFVCGCASTQPVSGILYSDVDGPVAVTSNSRGPAHGEACATSYLGLVAMGDASITAASKAGGIMTISYVEQHSSNILGIIVKYCTHVWGYSRAKGEKAAAAAATPAKVE